MKKIKLVKPFRFVSFVLVSLLLMAGTTLSIKATKANDNILVEPVISSNFSREESKVIFQEITEVSTSWKKLGEFKITGYCGENYPHICNNGDSTYTATMTKPQEGRTIAVDPNVIPYGSKVRINGIVYIAEDCGGAIKGNRIDIFFTSHDRALSYGVQNCEVWIERR